MKAIIRSAVSLLTTAFFFMHSAYSTPPFELDSDEPFTPSVGWASILGDPESGTLLRLNGIGFDPTPDNNIITFTDSSGQQLALAKAKWRKSNESTYEYERAFGSAGSSAGELGPIIRAVATNRSTGEVFVADIDNHRVEAFDKKGVFTRHIGSGVVDRPRGLAVDKDGNIFVSGDFLPPRGEGIAMFNNAGLIQKFFDGSGGSPIDRIVQAGDIGINDEWLYVIDQGPGPGFPKVVAFDIKDNEKVGAFSDVFWGTSLRIAVDPRGATSPESPSSALFYIGDKSNKTVYKYDFFVPHLSTFNFSGSSDVGQVAVDWEGFVYVDLGDKGIAKLDSSGNKISTVVPSLQRTYPPFRTIGIDKKIYLADMDSTGCNCIEVYSPTDTTQVFVNVPHDAKTGPIRIRVNTFHNTDISSEDFVVINDLDPVSLKKIEPTQGIWSYPFVTGKETLVWAELNGMFGHPKKDTGTLKLTLPNGTTIEQSSDHYRHDYKNKKTFAHFHIAKSQVQDIGNYKIEISLKRNGQSLNSPWEKTIAFHESKHIDLLFIKYTDIPNNQWLQKDPFPWFDMSTFLYGIETFKRTFPIHSDGVYFHFAAGEYKSFLADGLVNSEVDDVLKSVKDAFTKFQETDKVISTLDRPVGLLDYSLFMTTGELAGLYGINAGLPSVTFFEKTAGKWHDWGGLLAHELGHSYGLISSDMPNYIGKGGHSKNITLVNEKGAPITAWSAQIDWLLPAGANTMMSRGPGADDLTFFESIYKDAQGNFHKVDHDKLFNQLTKSTTSFSASDEYSEYNSEALSPVQIFVIIGSIDEEEIVTVDQSFITNAQLPLSDSEVSDYSLVFLDESGQALTTTGFGLSTAVAENGIGVIETRIFDLSVPYPTETASVEIRKNDEILETISPSDHPPSVNTIVVYTPPSSFPIISWQAYDPDNDPLTYSIDYSDDGGTSFMFVATGLTDTEFVWDDRYVGGSDAAVIRVTANDGFHRGSASQTFSLPKKKPLAVIMAPAEGEEYTQGSEIRVLGKGYDPEDGFIPGSNLTWRLLSTTDLGHGEEVVMHTMPFATPSGPISLPLEQGTHSLRLSVKDGDGNESATEVTFEIVGDTDRDGLSNEVEEQSGSDPFDPAVVPLDTDGDTVPDWSDNCPFVFDPSQQDTDNNGIGDACENHPPVALCADVTVSADANCEAYATVDNGSLDLDGDSLTFEQSPPAPYPLGTHDVTLTVTDAWGDSDTCTAAITVVDQDAPSISCNAPATIAPPDAPITFVASVIDNCEASVRVTEFDCFKFTKKGKRIDKTESCVVDIAGNIVTIEDSGGVGDRIQWAVEAIDTSDNTTTEDCSLAVTKP